MLARQIGTIQSPYVASDADALLDAAGGGGSSVQPAGLNTAPPDSGGGDGSISPNPSPANPGSGITLSPTANPTVSLVTPGAGGSGGGDNSGLLWAAAALGGAYLLSRNGGTVTGMLGKKGSKLLPLLVVGGLGAYLLLRKPASAQTPAGNQGGGGAQMAPTDQQRVFITNWGYSNAAIQSAMLAAVPGMSDSEVQTVFDTLMFIKQSPGAPLPAGLETQVGGVLQKYNIPGL